MYGLYIQSPSQNKYFKANCMIRGSFAEVTFPKRLLLKSVVGLFMLKLLVTLNASARNSSLFISRIWKALERERSNCHEPSPFMLPEPTFPNVPNPGDANAAELRKFPGERFNAGLVFCVPFVAGPEASSWSWLEVQC